MRLERKPKFTLVADDTLRLLCKLLGTFESRDPHISEAGAVCSNRDLPTPRVKLRRYR